MMSYKKEKEIVYLWADTTHDAMKLVNALGGDFNFTKELKDDWFNRKRCLAVEFPTVIFKIWRHKAA